MTSLAGPVVAADPAEISVRGNASDEELAAVLAVVSSSSRPADGYRRWQATRLAALRRAPSALDERG
jgi:acyl-CoA carboxylase epsilon subunit-like protein